ncbi:hypothetical protein BHE74_00044725 [Ensete ventricosum]|nr:hypothetical protein BHE74_00044725 [Ensete ventricosum]
MSSPEVGQRLYDVVGSSSRTHQKFIGKFVGSSPTSCRELASCSPEECWKFIGSLPKKIGSSLRTYQKFTGKFIGRSLTGCQELTGSSLEECWEFIEGNRELTEDSSRDDRTTKIVC